MEQFFELASDFIHDNWLKILSGFGLMLAGWLIGKYRARRQWRKREFFHRLNVSLNILRDGKLQIRTLIEKAVENVFLNAAAAEAVATAARRTTEKNPLLPLRKEDYWQYLNAVLNEIAERFAVGELRRDLGLPVTTGKYLICLTSECAGDIRTRKVRAMVIQKQTLEKLPEIAPQFEQTSHATRWKTLQTLAAEFRKHPHQFLEVEISV